jgi:uncharacterized protein DUF6308
MVSGPLILRRGVVEDPFAPALEFAEKYLRVGGDEASPGVSFEERDLRAANRGGARISAVQIAGILERRRAIEGALRAIPDDVSLVAPVESIPWAPLRRLFDAFADIGGVGFSKMTKALHPKRPALIPILDSVVQAYLADDLPARTLPFGERAVALAHGYKRDLDRNRELLDGLRRELASRGYLLTEVRILDILIWSVSSAG